MKNRRVSRKRLQEMAEAITSGTKHIVEVYFIEGGSGAHLKIDGKFITEKEIQNKKVLQILEPYIKLAAKKYM